MKSLNIMRKERKPRVIKRMKKRGIRYIERGKEKIMCKDEQDCIDEIDRLDLLEISGKRKY